MAVFKCKMCGGTLEINNETVAVCQYCGTKQTLPKLDDDRKANLYDRANHFRRNNEFDKAMGIYEQILNDDNTDAETYWSLVLCRYGIEYVEDPSSHKRIPTVNRAQFTSIFDDEDYKSALQYADGYQKVIYEQEATAINDIQKGILAISSQEEPFDVFICYKESDNSGRRTPDSVLATELYHELTREGYKVFFSRITLEDKLGTAYEPYIFAALNSAKVMVVLGTKPEFFNAVWVKNEWSRYLALIKNGARKMLIPAYKDMDPYDLPEEFSHLQAQDMSKLGFMQDLIRGIKKIVESDNTKQTIRETIIANDNAGGNVNALLKRGFMALEDGEWTKADDFFEQCLNQNAELAEAYLGKLMAELQVKTQDSLKDCAEPFEDRSNYQKTVRFADNKLKAFLGDIIQFINKRNEDAAREETYNRACNLMNLNSESGFTEAVQWFAKVSGYKDADILADECREKAEIACKERVYKSACEVLNDTHTWVGKKTDIKAHEEAIAQFQSLNGWKDSEEKILLCQKKIEEIKIQLEKERIEQEKNRVEKEEQEKNERLKRENRLKRNKKILIGTSLLIVIAIIFVIIFNTIVLPNNRYNLAMQYLNDGNYLEAYNVFTELGDYKNSIDKQREIEKNYPSIPFKNCSVGDVLRFGFYEQDGDFSNGKEDLMWKVLKVESNRVLVISNVCIESMPFQNTEENKTWETSSIREWLNNSFYNNFSAEQKSCIKTTYLNNDTYILNSNSGNNTNDNVFLLSVDEAQSYFDSDEARYCSFSKVASQNKDDSFWWLRTKGEGYLAATFVMQTGKISTHGVSYVYHDYGIRPAMWIDISNIK